MADPELVPTDRGDARITWSGVLDSGVAIALGHGAGGGIDAADLVAISQALADRVAIALVEQPWRVAGKKVAGPPPTLDEGWLPAIDHVRRRLPAGTRLIVGGRSAGARVACRTASRVGADAVLALSFPLHPPGKPEKSRADELLLPSHEGIDTWVVQGRRDPFGSPEEITAAGFPADRIIAVDGTHSPNPGQAAAAVTALLERAW